MENLGFGVSLWWALLLSNDIRPCHLMLWTLGLQQHKTYLTFCATVAFKCFFSKSTFASNLGQKTLFHVFRITQATTNLLFTWTSRQWWVTTYLPTWYPWMVVIYPSVVKARILFWWLCFKEEVINPFASVISEWDYGLMIWGCGIEE
jgi:hypothetical protein